MQNLLGSRKNASWGETTPSISLFGQAPGTTGDGEQPAHDEEVVVLIFVTVIGWKKTRSRSHQEVEPAPQMEGPMHARCTAETQTVVFH
jgi:hypothetical protein